MRGYLWDREARPSGCHLSRTQFANLAIEGEVAVRLCRDLPEDIASDDALADCVECWFPVIELHNYVFRGPTPSRHELVAGNAMHAGFVAPLATLTSQVAVSTCAEIKIEIDGRLVETSNAAELAGGPLGSLRWLANSVARSREMLKAGDIVLTGSPGRLIPVNPGCGVVVTCAGQRVELIIDPPASPQVCWPVNSVG